MFETEHDQKTLKDTRPPLGRVSCEVDVPDFGAGHPLLRPRVSRQPGRSVLKRVLDLAISIPALILLTPVLLVIALVIWMSDGGAPVFVQSRYGRDGKPFRFYKFRSMRIDAEARLEALLRSDPLAAEEWRKQRKLREDPRITGFGEFIRIWSLDELPQLLNIVRGEMSIVGPRPLVHDTSDSLDDKTLYGPDFRFYRMARPGLTGLWQVNGRAGTLFSERVARDIEYVSTWSVWQDLKIMAQTIPAVFLRRGAL